MAKKKSVKKRSFIKSKPSKKTKQSLVSLERVKIGISYLLKASLIIAIGTAIWKTQWFNALLIIIIFFFTFLPSLIERNYKLCLPGALELSINIFVYAAVFLGEFHSFYNKFWWWDIALHASSGVIAGFAGFLLVYTLRREVKIQLDMGEGLMSMFAFSFAVTLAVFWEIFEFFMDLFFGLVMQRGSLTDTMLDLIVAVIGAFIISVIGYLYIKRGREDLMFNKIIMTFMRTNPALFKKRNIRKRIKKKIKRLK